MNREISVNCGERFELLEKVPMRFSCESCGAQYMISDDKVGPGGVKVRCKKCGNVIPVRRAAGASSDVAAAGAAGGASAAAANVEVDVDRDLDQAFQNVLGGGSMAGGAAAELGGAPAEPNAVADPDLATEWYVAIDDRQVGPIPPAGVRSRWEAGEIGPDTLAWRAGMADWSPLASIPEMTRYLAGAATKAPAGSHPRAHDAGETQSATAAPAVAPSASGVNGKLNGHDGWQPSAASALAALAAQELTPEKPLAVPAAPGASPPSSGSSLLDRMNLPEGGVDPTNLIPLPMKGVETTEVDLKPKAAVEPERTEIRQIRKEAKRSGAAMGVAVALVLAAGIGAALWLFRPVVAEHPAPVAAVVPATPSIPAPQVTAPAPPPQAAAAQPTTPPVAAAPAAATAAPAATQAPAAVQAPAPQPPAPAPAEARAERHPAAEATAAREAPAPPAPDRASVHRPSKAEAAAARKAARERVATAAPQRPQRVASTEPLARPAAEPRPASAPEPAPAVAAPRKKGGDPLLDVGGDDDLEKELSSTKPKRSVYVPPAMGSDLPESVSVSQINEAVVGQKAALLRCIEQQRAADPNTRGTLKVRWLIGGDGAPRDVAVLSDEFAKQPIGTCISGVVKGIRFPRSRTSGQEVVFPFKF